MSQHKYWLGFSLIPEIGPRRLQRLRESFDDLGEAWHAPETKLRSTGLEPRIVSNLIQQRAKIDLTTEMSRISKVGARLITLDDSSYPPFLRETSSPPIVLYVKGDFPDPLNRTLAVVGTRKATQYGKDIAFQFSRDLAYHNVVIVSGLAQGIDIEAHKGALDGGGYTIAVLGCGIDRVYPYENQKYASAIIKQGALISEFPIGSRPDRHHFPRRNRIISGMSLGVLIVEAPINSGALITAEIATEQGRDVFAIPGNIFQATSHGPNRLIQDGAKAITNVEDILEELNIVYEGVERRQQTESIAPTTEVESSILRHMTVDPIHIDDLVRLSGLPVALVSSTLTILELKGLVRAFSQMQYGLVNKI